MGFRCKGVVFPGSGSFLCMGIGEALQTRRLRYRLFVRHLIPDRCKAPFSVGPASCRSFYGDRLSRNTKRVPDSQSLLHPLGNSVFLVSPAVRLRGLCYHVGTNAACADLDSLNGARRYNSHVLKIRIRDFFGAIMRVADVISLKRLFAAYLTNA